MYTLQPGIFGEKKSSDNITMRMTSPWNCQQEETTAQILGIVGLQVAAIDILQRVSKINLNFFIFFDFIFFVKIFIFDS